MESKTIYCPRCGRKVTTYDGRATINLLAKCKKCKKLVVYDIENDKTVLKPLPERKTSSGVTFC